VKEAYIESGSKKKYNTDRFNKNTIIGGK